MQRPSTRTRLIERIHAAAPKLVLAVTGGGSQAIADLLSVPGASRTVLEACVPYSAAALESFVAARLEQACSEPAARAMAMAAFQRARRLVGEAGGEVLGVAATASLATDRTKRGAHRVHLAVQSAAATEVQSLTLEKSRRTRPKQERLCADLLLTAIAGACRVAGRLPLRLAASERVSIERAEAPREWQQVLLGAAAACRHGVEPDRPAPGQRRAILPGSFHPLHEAHLAMARLARQRLATPVEFELSVHNVDKAPLDYLELSRRLRRFAADETVWITNAPTFVEKSRLFAPAVFIVGIDTMLRIADSRYYGGDSRPRDEALRQIVDGGCRFLVFGRRVDDRFQSLDDVQLPEPLRDVSQGVPASEFHYDISSTELRRETV